MSRNLRLYGRRLRNLQLYREFQQIGFDYILNPTTGELHIVDSSRFYGSHNLETADLENFIGLANLNSAVPAHSFHNGTELAVYDLETGEFIDTYILDKCEYCFPD